MRSKIILKMTESYSVQFSSVTQSCLTLCDLVDGSLPGSPVPGMLQARTLEWDAIAFSVIPTRMAIILITNIGKDVEKLEHLYIAGENLKWSGYCGT